MALECQSFSDQYPSLTSRENTIDFFSNLIRPTYDQKESTEIEDAPLPKIAESVEIEEFRPQEKSLNSSFQDDHVHSVTDLHDSVRAGTTMKNSEIETGILDSTDLSVSNQSAKKQKNKFKLFYKLLPVLLLPILAYGIFFLVFYLSKIYENPICPLYYIFGT